MKYIYLLAATGIMMLYPTATSYATYVSRMPASKPDAPTVAKAAVPFVCPDDYVCVTKKDWLAKNVRVIIGETKFACFTMQ